MWIDGKPIYRKYYDLTGETNGTIIDTITNLDTLTNSECFGKHTSNGLVFHNVANTAEICALFYQPTTHKIDLRLAYYSAMYGWIEYTKTTD